MATAETLCGKKVDKIYSGGINVITRVGLTKNGVVTYQQHNICKKNLGTLKGGKLTALIGGVTIKLRKKGKRIKIHWNNPKRGTASTYLY